MLEQLAVLIAGCLAGSFTGLVPGIHPNTVIFSSLPLYFSFNIDIVFFAAFLTGMSVSHTFHDFLPSIFLGVAEAESALASVPGADLAARGRGLEAFRLTLGGGLVSLVAFILLAVPLNTYLQKVYSLVEPVMAYLLLFFLVFAVMKARNSWRASIVASMSSTLGLLAFKIPVNQNYVLIPVFSGLFAVPAVLKLFGASFDIPEQRKAGELGLNDLRGGVFGLLAGLIAGIVPGVGAATSTATLTPLMDSTEEFLASMGAVNTSDLVVSFIALQAIGKARSGPAVALDALSSMDLHFVVYLVGMALAAAAVSSLIALKTSKVFAREISRVSSNSIAISALTPLVLVSAAMTGLPGLLILLTASCIGVAARESNSRAACMAVLIAPAILYYTNFSL